MLRMLEAQAPAKQTATHTIDTLSNRLSTASLLEDRRAAIHGLRSFAKDYPASVASGALRPLISCLSNDKEDVDTVKPVLETLLALFNPSEQSPEASEDIALWLADEFTQRQDNIKILLDLLDSPDFYSRLYALKLLTCIFAARPERTQECILGAALGTSRLVATLDDGREAIRNAGILLLSDLTQSSMELQKLVAFENAFDRVFNLIREEGSLEQGGIVVQDCLDLLASLVRQNPSNQSLFRETGCVSRLAQLLRDVHGNGSGEPEEERWPSPNKDKNIWGMLAVIRLFLGEGAVGTQENQTAFFRHGLLQQVLELAFHASSEAPIQAEALYTCADMVRGNHTLQTSFAGLQVPAKAEPKQPAGTNGHTNGIPKAYVIEALLDISVVPASQTPFEVRMAACECIKAYLHKHAEVRHHFLSRAIEGHMSGQDETANVVSMLLREELRTQDPYRVWFAADLVFSLLWEDPKAKNMLMTVTEGDAESGEEVVTCIQTLASNLLTAIQREEDERIIIAYFTVLSGWLFEDGSAVNDFLGEGSNVQTLKQNLAVGGLERTVIKGLAAVLLGVTYEFSTKDSPIPRRKLQPLLTAQLGRERYLQALSQLRQHPLVRDFEVVPQGAAPPNSPELPPYAFFDAIFIDFLKDNFSRLSRAIDRDPGLEAQIPSREEGIDRDLVDSLRAQLDEKAQAIQKLENDLLSTQRQLDQEQAASRKAVDTSAAEVHRIKQINEALQKNHESDITSLKATHGSEYETLRTSTSQQIQDLQQRVETMQKAAADEAARTKEYYERTINGLRSTKTSLESKLTEASKKEESYRDINSKSQQALRQGVEELTNVRKYATELEGKIKDRDKQIDALTAKQTELLEALEDERTKISMLEKEAEGFEGKLKTHIEKAEKAEKEIKAKEEEKAGVQTELDDLMIILGDLEEKRTQDKKRLKELGETVSDDEEEDDDGDGDEVEEEAEEDDVD